MSKNKTIQRTRMWKYFVEATADIILEEGVPNVTIRKIADRAGYNSATIYNYFSELSHLVFFAAMKFLKPYTEAVVQTYQDPQLSAQERYLRVWEIFCQHSFQNPQIFHAIFIADLGSQPEELLSHYYSVYPADLIAIPEELQPMLGTYNINRRGLISLELLVKEGFLLQQKIEAVNELTLLIWQGMFTAFLNNRSSYAPEEAARHAVRYIREIVLNANQLNLEDETRAGNTSPLAPSL
ncbi:MULTISPECIES: TetR/AcrR family transcriptional regulator [Brevibacillus]|uniref:TetR/AcrR family transcriptional regulator n=1 Tax=Brevibacillus TaxID=55080 RepID=UPI001FE4B01C|nr:MULTISPECIES: TetR/AcrR family transcriptional regulator [Brevibacillus]MEC2131351.1 TetR/AcrR family transcriptional regulator [Brevibacillus centrosporus]MED1793460.1 TetR/AcrR family transcriptional regulator [Brevibacillus nitrificans]MED4906876.1 TetR/AcrR family transcriptional regulator [Brevibacillus centrosporus]